MVDQPEFLTVDDVAAELGLSSKQVRRLIKSGALAHHRFGRLLRISRADLDCYIASCRVGR